MKFLKISRVGCRKELLLFGRRLFSWIDTKKAIEEIWRQSRWMKSYFRFRQFNIELPADVERYWTGRYEFLDVKLSDLFRYSVNNQLVPLCESPMALYCKTHDERHLRSFYPAALEFGITSDNEDAYVAEERAHLDHVASQMAESGFKYDLSKSCVVIDANNVVLDGNHRLSILFAKYGPSYSVRALRIV